jgi:hypothetical protein
MPLTYGGGTPVLRTCSVPTELAYMPVNSVERLGAHTGAVENAREPHSFLRKSIESRRAGVPISVRTDVRTCVFDHNPENVRARSDRRLNLTAGQAGPGRAGTRNRRDRTRRRDRRAITVATAA